MQANGLDERTNLLVEEYSTSGRLDNITQVMSIHTQYLESFLRSQFYMLRMDGPLPLPYRHYIAIMVCTSRLCIFSFELDFLIWEKKKKEEFRKKRPVWYFVRVWIFLVGFYQNEACLATRCSVRRVMHFSHAHENEVLQRAVKTLSPYCWAFNHQRTAAGWDATVWSHTKFQVGTWKTDFTMRMLRHCNEGQEGLCVLQGWTFCLDKALSNLI